jgi:3'-phosphoadenosine 5'-phosphosulfate sulfotransferase (PAPS reductase)/FAD synthetase
MIHIGSISSGLSSAIACDRLLKKYPDAVLVFEDVLFEDEDNYRFLKDCKKRWNKIIVQLCDGRNPYEVSRAERVIPTSLLAPCSFRLKMDIFKAWLKTLPDQEITIHIGFDFTEMERMDGSRKGYAEMGYQVDFPLEWKPIEFRPYSQVVKEDWGIEPPRMYKMGYTHANCGGRCCKQGQGDWIRTLINFPERYAEIEQWEREMRQLSEKHSHRAILKRMNGGIAQELTLEQLRLEYEAVDGRMDLCSMDEQSPCVVCGIGF